MTASSPIKTHFPKAVSAARLRCRCRSGRASRVIASFSMTAMCPMPTSGRSCRAFAGLIAPPSSESSPKRKSADGSSAFDLPPRRRTSLLRRGAGVNPRSPDRCPIGSKSRSAIRSISPRIRCHPVCIIACSDWLLFRTPSSPRRRRCTYRLMTSRASSPVPSNTQTKSACRAVAWTTYLICCRTCGLRPKCETSATLASLWTWNSEACCIPRNRWLRATYWPTISASCPPRPRLERPSLRRG